MWCKCDANGLTCLLILYLHNEKRRAASCLPVSAFHLHPNPWRIDTTMPFFQLPIASGDKVGLAMKTTCFPLILHREMFILHSKKLYHSASRGISSTNLPYFTRSWLKLRRKLETKDLWPRFNAANTHFLPSCAAVNTQCMWTEFAKKMKYVYSHK